MKVPGSLKITGARGRRPEPNGSQETQAQALAREILSADDAVLAVIVSDPKGLSLAYVVRENTKTRVLTDKNEIKRLGLVELLALKLGSRPNQDFGEIKYLAYVYESFKLVVAELRSPPSVVGLKITRSSNTEYLVDKVLREHM